MSGRAPSSGGASAAAAPPAAAASAAGPGPGSAPVYASGCPVVGANPANQMPPSANEPLPGQRKPLSTWRQQSNIPTGAADALPTHQAAPGGASAAGEPVWVYPSEQMFYNAMRRKGWTPSEDDMAAVVAIHNTGQLCCWGAAAASVLRLLLCCREAAEVQPPGDALPGCLAAGLPSGPASLTRAACTRCALAPIPCAVNERAWREIMRWEAVKGQAAQCGGPKLVKFR